VITSPFILDHFIDGAQAHTSPSSNNMDHFDGAQAHPAEGMPEGWTIIIVPRNKGNGGKTRGVINDKYWYSPKESYKFNAAVKVRRFLAVLDQVGGDEVVAYRLYLKKGRNGGSGDPKTVTNKHKAPTVTNKHKTPTSAGTLVHKLKKRLMNDATHAKKKTKSEETIVLPPGFRVPCGFVVVYEGSPVEPKKNPMTKDPSEHAMTPSAIRSRQWRERQKQKRIEEEGKFSMQKKHANNVQPSYGTRRCSRTQT
jgi:hypothetical protein